MGLLHGLGGRAPWQMVRSPVARFECTSHGRVRPSRVSARVGDVLEYSSSRCDATCLVGLLEQGGHADVLLARRLHGEGESMAMAAIDGLREVGGV